MVNQIFKYFVEGACEEKLVDILKSPDFHYLKPGKVEVFNVAKEEITKARVLSIKQGTTVVLIYDTDVVNDKILESNVKMFKQNTLSTVYHIQSVKNFEDEILKSTSLRKITEFASDVYSIEDFKESFINHKDLYHKLKSINFNPDKLWNTIDKTAGCSKYTSKEARKKIKQNDDDK